MYIMQDHNASADPEGGGNRGSGPPPWDLSEVGSCVEAWWVGEGIQWLFSLYYYLFFFWLASLASIIQTYYIYTYFQVQYSLWNGHPFSILPLSLWKESNIHERASSYFSCLKLHDFAPFKTNIFWGRTPWPPPLPRHIYNIKLPCHLCVNVERGLQLYKRPCPSEKKNLVCR